MGEGRECFDCPDWAGRGLERGEDLEIWVTVSERTYWMWSFVIVLSRSEGC